MADTIHTVDSGGNSMGFFMGIIILILFVLFIMYYGLPMMRGSTSGGQINIPIPDKIDVNVNQPAK